MIVYKDNNGYKAVYDNIVEMQKDIRRLHNNKHTLVICDNNKKWKDVKLITDDNKLNKVGVYYDLWEK